MSIVNVNKESLSVRGGLATADIWMEVDGISFPKVQWNDFAIVIMGWWCVGLIRLLRNESAREIFDFMDGPYSVELSRTEGSAGRLSAFEGAGRRCEVASGGVVISEFAHDFVIEARILLRRCKEINWWSTDANQLDESLKILSEILIRSHGNTPPSPPVLAHSRSGARG